MPILLVIGVCGYFITTSNDKREIEENGITVSAQATGGLITERNVRTGIKHSYIEVRYIVGNDIYITKGEVAYKYHFIDKYEAVEANRDITVRYLPSDPTQVIVYDVDYRNGSIFN